jgi:flagellar hook-associated protein 2
MGRITTGTGLISGINSKDIIDQLIALEEQPKARLQTQKDTLAAQKLAYTKISSNLSVLTSLSRTLQRPSTFSAAKATSTDDGILTASTTPGAAVGSYQFQVARLVTSQQSISAGYADPTSAVKAGNLTVELGGGNLDTETELSALNGGAGVRRGSFRLTDRSGQSAVIDLTAAVSLDDVVKKINTSLDASVKASLDGDKLVLTDTSGGTESDLVVQDLGDGHAAEDLGIVGRAASGTLAGTDFNRLNADTALSALNDGLGVRRKAGGPDLIITAKNGSKTNVTFGADVETVGEAIDAINQAAGGKVTAALNADGKGIKLTDGTGGGGSLSVADGTGSKAATDLGLAKSAAAGALVGGRVQSGADTVLLRSLNGGAGLGTGTVTIKDRSGTTKDVDLTGATTVQELLDKINDAGLAVTASLNPARNGIQIAGSGTGTGSLVITDKTGTTAADLGVAGTFAAATDPVAKGKNLQLKWVGEGTLLADYNGGKGVTPGSFRVTNSKGNQVVVDLSDTDAVKTIGDVIAKINGSGAGVTASVNEHGDGLLLTDSAGGTGKLKVENVTGTSATDLNLLGEAAVAGGTGTIDGSFEKTIAVSATDSLQSVAEKIRAASFGATANVLNDGSGATPYRLSLTSYNSGVAGRVVFDAGATGLDTHTLVEARDAAVFVGGTGSAEPLLVSSSTNQLSNVVAGVNIELHGAGTDPVTLNVARDADGVVDAVSKFVDNFNTVVTTIDELTRYDSTTQKRGLLLGEGTIQQVQAAVYQAVQGTVAGAGRYDSLFAIGISVTSSSDFAASLADKESKAATTNADGSTTSDTTDDSSSTYVATLSFDEDKFRAAIAADPEALKNVFTQLASGLNTNTPFAKLHDGKGVRVAGGGKPDFQVALKDGTKFAVTLPATDGTVADLVTAVSAASAGKVTVSINSGGTGLSVVDNTTGTATFGITSQNGSGAALDLGLEGTWPTGTAGGSVLFPNAKRSGGGFGYLIEQRLNTLVDPVDGLISRQNNTLDSRSRQFEQRIDDIGTLIQQKRTRLEKQFANMESVLAKLQSQQSALSGLSA